MALYTAVRVTFKTTILSFCIAIRCEWLFAESTKIFVVCFPFYKVKMAVPPLVSAAVRTEPLAFASFLLDNLPAALLTHGILLVQSISSEI